MRFRGSRIDWKKWMNHEGDVGVGVGAGVGSIEGSIGEPFKSG